MNIQLIAVILLHLVCNERLDAYSHYRDLIPNGRRVTHPCKANYMWYGVGHEREQGGGVRNSFGKDFKLYGETWNECLCRLDSDQDGKTNGEELGDPECKWQPGQTPDRVAGITHPGICDPFEDSRCEDINSFVDCEVSEEFECDALQEPGVQDLTFRLDDTEVPSDDTTYICQSFDLPTDEDYHMIAAVPELVNNNVMHHLVVYGCRADEYNDEVSNLYSTPNSNCIMVPCFEIIFVWSLGSGGQCLDPNMAFRLGANGYQHLILELHWNNPEMISGYRDSSGFTLYYTTDLRPNDAGVFSVAPVFLEIPPGHVEHEVSGTCSGECTGALLEENSINITYVFPHMHYLGTKMKFEHIRDGQVLRLIDFPEYFYDSPEIVYLEDPIEVFGGDELKVTCYYESLSRRQFTFYGEETNDEMCFAILTYYPYYPNVAFCSMDNGYGSCDVKFNRYNTSECDMQSFYTAFQNFQENTGDKCDSTGYECLDECPESIAPINDHPCLETPAASAIMAGQMYYYNSLGEDYGHEIFSKLGSCDPKPDVDHSHESSHEDVECGISSGQTMNFGMEWMAVLIIVLIFMLIK